MLLLNLKNTWDAEDFDFGNFTIIQYNQILANVANFQIFSVAFIKVMEILVLI